MGGAKVNVQRRTCGVGGGPCSRARAEHDTSGEDGTDAALVEVFHSAGSGWGWGRCRLLRGEHGDNGRMARADFLTFALTRSGRVGGV